jgi:hypothetical protein
LNRFWSEELARSAGVDLSSPALIHRDSAGVVAGAALAAAVPEFIR